LAAFPSPLPGLAAKAIDEALTVATAAAKHSHL
jgi:hypothetical protein